jgi:magnesium transporter
MNVKAIDLYLNRLKNGLNGSNKVEDADIADYLEEVKHKDEDKFFEYLISLPHKVRAETFIELPTSFQLELILKFDAEGLATIVENLDSDDATDLMIAIGKADKDKEEAVFVLLDDSLQKTIEKLLVYDDDEAGSVMQTELLKVCVDQTINDAIEKLVKLKEAGIGSVQSLFVVDIHGKLLKTIALDDLIIEKKKSKFTDIIDKFPVSHAVSAHDDIDIVLNTIEKYDLTSLGVVDRMGHLIGRITHDDVVDLMEERATKQMYAMNKLDGNEEIQENFAQTSKTRAIWLSINLINAIFASLVIGIFEEALDAIVALAVLMPIVANMAGTASVQTMTVVVRQMALGELTFSDVKPLFKKEMNVALLNGILFGVMSSIVSWVWFGSTLIAIAIGFSMFVSFLSAGLLGASVPLLLKKINLDPAVASSVVVITLVDIIGFFSFLWFAELIIL